MYLCDAITVDGQKCNGGENNKDLGKKNIVHVQNMSTSLLLLPSDILLQVLRYLPFSSLCTCAQVCKELNSKIATLGSLWYETCHLFEYVSRKFQD